MTRHRHTLRPTRSGVVTVEFAVLLPLLILILIGALEVGCAFHTLCGLQNAAREGARRAVVPGATAESVIAACDRSLAIARVQGATVEVSPDPGSASAGAMIGVTVSAAFGDNSWLPTSRFFVSKRLSAGVSMRKE